MRNLNIKVCVCVHIWPPLHYLCGILYISLPLHLSRWCPWVCTWARKPISGAAGTSSTASSCSCPSLTSWCRWPAAPRSSAFSVFSGCSGRYAPSGQVAFPVKAWSVQLLSEEIGRKKTLGLFMTISTTGLTAPGPCLNERYSSTKRVVTSYRQLIQPELLNKCEFNV